ncbi:MULTISPECIES: class IV lanthionine synthetase LanL [unclassified Streptomyces]|uniref:class IV lanthionine synthetase LanL n=1 Tax=unclassified Streptomyces TaxID=2593676 RepID=UPI000BF2C238|nr:class IV lanthionine synthetase LanL [Streptomyces sp. Ru87]PGH47249.1 serine/threonine protein kinase [Streptomyces sp. Ru87]
MSSQPQHPDHLYVDDFLGVRDEVVALHGWDHSLDDMWCHVLPPGHYSRPQGWKIHLSATPSSAASVLRNAARVLLERGVAFKFAKGVAQLRQLLSVRCNRGSGGKFITVYPEDDRQFAELVDELHRATEGMTGPKILSDRRYRPGSLVHYRFGGFSGRQQILDADGSYVPMLVTPDGGWFQDKREAWYAPVPWAEPPVPDAAPVRTEAERGQQQVLLDSRFAVFEAIRHSNRGGVYRAEDRRTGRTVVIKEARPYVAAEFDGTDARDYLRNEHEILRLFEGMGIAPRPVSLFEYQDHVFLAEEEIPGVTLRAWVERQVREHPDHVISVDAVLPVARQLVTLVATVHDKGLVFRDLTPNNVMVTPDGTLVLIDTEFVARPGELVTRVMTMGYVAPEEMTGPPRYPAPGQDTDLYSLGASLFFLCTGVHPLLAEDVSAEPRPLDDRLAFLVDAVAGSSPTLRAFAPLVLGLLRQDARQRTGLSRVQEVLASMPGQQDTGGTGGGTGAGAAPAAQAPVRLPAEEQQRLLDDGVRELVAAMTPHDERSLWPAVPYDGRLFDSLSLQAGCAGSIDALRRTLALKSTGEPGGTGEADTVRRALRTSVTWLEDRLRQDQRLLPGLFFGRAGTCWALYEAAEALGDEGAMRRAVQRVKRLPVAWANPDITHGVAGSGLAQLHLWRRTGDEELARRVAICAESVLAARPAGEPTLWPLPESPNGRAGTGPTHLGYAHGVAGICTFLMTVARELDRPELLATAAAGGDYLLSVAQEQGDGFTWPVAPPQPGDAESQDGVCWWCSGASGIGTFLIRLWRATGETKYREAAHRAAVATRAEKWFLSASHCHGVAGNAEFLLDMVAATGEPVYREWAEEYATCLARLCVLRDGRLVPIDDVSLKTTYSYNLGLSGSIGFLHRLRHGGERWWMVDDFALAPEGPR